MLARTIIFWSMNVTARLCTWCAEKSSATPARFRLVADALTDALLSSNKMGRLWVKRLHTMVRPRIEMVGATKEPAPR